MPLPAQSSTTAPRDRSAVLVGDDHLIVDRALAASQTFSTFALLVRSGAYWRPTNAALADADTWAADHATALGDVVIPATRPVTVTQSGTGTGTPTVTAAAGARAGTWQAVCVAAASNSGTFRVSDPTGVDLGAVTVGTAATLGGVTWSIADATDFVKGDRIYAIVGALHAYQATAVAGDTKTHGTTEPTWPTNGSTVTDDQVTWTDLGAVDDLRDHAQFGVLGYVGDAFSTGSAAHPTLPVILTGQVSLAELAGLPAAYVAGDQLGLLTLEA